MLHYGSIWLVNVLYKGLIMKYTQILLLISLLGGTAMAVNFYGKKELVKGTTVGRYAKPGAPVDITYTAEHANTGDISDVHIVLTSSLSSGVMHVQVNIDKRLNEITAVSKELLIPLKSSNEKYPIDLKVSADNDGLYYIKLLVSIKDIGFRAFAVPIYVGSRIVKVNKNSMQKTKNGENITVFPAEETIINNPSSN